jgi:DNA uptake protein ComE-like DNA-binding protein
MRVRLTALAMLCVCLPGTAQYHEQYYRAPTASAEDTPPEDRIDINHASVHELLKVPGMTRSWAGRIVRFRPYHTKLDLTERGVVSGEVYSRIKDYVIAHREKQ